MTIGVRHSLPGESGLVEVLSGIDLTIERNEFVTIVGPSGCGKTTFLNIVAGLEPLQSGVLMVNGAPPSAGRRGIAYAFARDALLAWRTAVRNVELPLEIIGMPKTERRARALEELERVGLREHANAYRSQLSQGMRQRVALARTLVPSPELLLMDEPFAALDAQTRLQMQQVLLQNLAVRSTTVLFVTHDLGEAIALSDRVVLFSKRPAQIKSVFRIDLPRPRTVMSLQSDPTYHAVLEELWEQLRDEVVDVA